MEDFWLQKHRDFPSEQTFWRTNLFDTLWPAEDQRFALASVVSENAESKLHPWAVSGLDDIHRQRLRDWCLDQADDVAAVHDWRLNDSSRVLLAKALAAAVQRASLTLARLARGEVVTSSAAGWTTANMPPQTADIATGFPATDLSITGLLEGWWKEGQAAGRKPSTYDSYRNTVASFIAFLKHDDASRLTADDVIRFKDYRLVTPSRRTGRIPSARTVKSIDLSALKTVFGWAVANRKMVTNPASGVTIKLSKPQKLRSKGFTDNEAATILSAALLYLSDAETPRTAAAKRWVPWLCAYTGARVGELAQLRKQDIRREGEWWIARITPEAGTVKTNEAREIVLHEHLVELGFGKFVEGSEEGHLFLKLGKHGDVRGPLQGLKNRLAEFARALVQDPGVAPNHGWRHRFKTVGMEAGIPPRILDAMQGQAAKSVADTYGDVTIKTMAANIAKLARVNLSDST